MTHCSTKSVIKFLKAYFEENGLPAEIKTDNGAAFKSSEFSNFLSDLSIKLMPILEAYIQSKTAASKKQGDTGTIKPESKDTYTRRFAGLINATDGLWRPSQIKPHLLSLSGVNSAKTRATILREFEKFIHYAYGDREDSEKKLDIYEIKHQIQVAIKEDASNMKAEKKFHDDAVSKRFLRGSDQLAPSEKNCHVFLNVNLPISPEDNVNFPASRYKEIQHCLLFLLLLNLFRAGSVFKMKNCYFNNVHRHKETGFLCSHIEPQRKNSTKPDDFQEVQFQNKLPLPERRPRHIQLME